MATIEELSQQLQDKENELFAATRELNRLQGQLDESRERESNLASEHQLDSVRNNERIGQLTRQHEELEARYRELVTANRSIEETRKSEEATTQRLERELRSALLDLHAKESEVADLIKRQTVLQEGFAKCEALKKRVAELEAHQKEEREELKMETLKVKELSDKLAKKEIELENCKREAQDIFEANERLNEEMKALLVSSTQKDEDYAQAKPLSVNTDPHRGQRNRAVSQPPDEGDDGATTRHFSERFDVGVASYIGGGYGLHDDFGSQTPRRGSIMVPGGDNFTEPLLKDETMVGLPSHTNLGLPRLVDKETQTIIPMSPEVTPRGSTSQQQGCPQCVIC